MTKRTKGREGDGRGQLQKDGIWMSHRQKGRWGTVRDTVICHRRGQEGMSPYGSRIGDYGHAGNTVRAVNYGAVGKLWCTTLMYVPGTFGPPW